MDEASPGEADSQPDEPARRPAGTWGADSDDGADESNDDRGDESRRHPDDESDGDGVAGEFVPEGPVEPEEPVLEHAVAILFGALVTILATGELVLADYGLETMALLAGGTVLAGLVLFGYFGLFGEIRALIADRTP